ncbi:DUF2243 domain-containing protein [Paracoccus sp. TK19116]|uniref:DUF2243 domain-containing protein n=1 Tax=Paracoccus albicereus TaxID=2922394 RepID=A0ABT1MUP9_9RHOB|nr:DUF2243 domain-containing protein [Paracoccus albicereus]MCQ0972072.1 DUF2243 domain-containing protein [Paracoccus albicereus]
MTDDNDMRPKRFPLSAGILLGLGVGGFFDGIVLHQILQWHHMATSVWLPVDGASSASEALRNLKLNTVLDGLFHAATYIFVLAGLVVLWRSARKTHMRWSSRRLSASLLMGFGIFNVVEGLIDHHLLGIHHVNETVPRGQWIYWDLAFLAWGGAMLIAGWLLSSRTKSDQPIS